MHNPLRALVALLFAASLAHPATGLIIDNFEEGDFSVTDPFSPTTPTFGEVSGLSGSNVVGGVRLVRVQKTSGGTGNALLVTTGGDDGAVLSSSAPAAALTDFAFIYDGVANGASDGSAGALNIDLSGDATVDVEASAVSVVGGIRLTLWTSTDSASTGIQPLVNGTNSLLIDGTLLALDLTDIQAILIAVTDINLGEVPTILDIRTTSIPEPGTGFLMAVGLVALAIRRTRSQ